MTDVMGVIVQVRKPRHKWCPPKIIIDHICHTQNVNDTSSSLVVTLNFYVGKILTLNTKHAFKHYPTLLKTDYNLCFLTVRILSFVNIFGFI